MSPKNPIAWMLPCGASGDLDAVKRHRRDGRRIGLDEGQAERIDRRIERERETVRFHRDDEATLPRYGAPLAEVRFGLGAQTKPNIGG
jgi:hypothetical protein